MINILLSRSLGFQPKVYDWLKPLVNQKTKVCIIALSYFDFQVNNYQHYLSMYTKDGEYYNKMIKSFIPLGIPEDKITWVYHDPSQTKEALKLIDEADIIYFPGGAPDLMYQRIADLGFLDALKAQSKIYIGSSAGAMIQGDYYHISKDDEYHRFALHQGLGYYHKFGIEVHFKPRKQAKKGIWRVKKQIKRPVYAIKETGAIMIKNGEITTLIDAFMYTDGFKKTT